jgi:hypothetical protein
MDKYVNSDINLHLMKLIQIGANVQVVSGKMVYVKFCLEDGTEIAYVYHMNKKNKYFLERIKPYPLSLKEFNTANEVIDIIQVDYKQYQNAIKSKNVKEFIEMNKEMHKTIKSFEDLFLYYNIDHELLEEINTCVTHVQKLIKEGCTKYERLFFEKDPENL